MTMSELSMTAEETIPARSRSLGDLLAHPWLTTRVQIALGLIFIVASLPKIQDPPSFAHMIYNYRVVPGALINLFALVMPWVELLAGVLLVLGIWTRPARNVVAGLLLVFMTAIAINLIRGNAVDCGCFDVSAANRTWDQRIHDMWFVILRDTGMLLMVAQLWWSERKRREI
jgi:putative oxidoreductase